jgi:hypothetical protein
LRIGRPTDALLDGLKQLPGGMNTLRHVLTFAVSVTGTDWQEGIPYQSVPPVLSFLTKFTIPPFLAIQTKLKLDIRSKSGGMMRHEI